MQITLSYEQQMELEKDIRDELDIIKSAGDALKFEVEQAHEFGDLRMGIGWDFQKVQAGLNVFLGVVEQLDDVNEEFSGSMADAERGKVLRRIHARLIRGISHRATYMNEWELAANTKLLELFWAV